MNTLERPSVVAIAVVDEDIAAARIYVLLRGCAAVATITDHLIAGGKQSLRVKPRAAGQQEWSSRFVWHSLMNETLPPNSMS